MAHVLQAADITKNFGDFAAVRGVSFSIAKGECVALLGPNGAGKTTTAEILEGLQEPTTGTVHLFGMEYRKQRRSIQERVGIVLQETRLYKKFTIKETLELFASFFSQSEDVEKIITTLQLTDKKDVRLENLSGGQRQRVYLGCALVNNPELLFLDEPTAGLDPQSRRMLWELLEQFKAEKRSILLTTHYMDEAEHLADRVLVMDHGSIIAEGTPRTLIEKYCGREILSLQFNEEQDPTVAWERLQEKFPFLSEAIVTKSGFELAVGDDGAALAMSFTRACDDQKIPLRALEMRRSTLEDVFLKLTGRSIRDA